MLINLLATGSSSAQQMAQKSKKKILFPVMVMYSPLLAGLSCNNINDPLRILNS